MALKLPPLDARILKWNPDDLLERNCPICNLSDTDTRYIRPDALSIRLCKRCNTFFVTPAPSHQQLFSFYATYDENHRRASSISTKELLREYQRIEPLSDYRIRELSSLMTLRNAKVLDVGFGRAKFLYFLMKLGALPYGIELDEKSIEFAKALGIHNVFHGTITELTDKTKYDLIILNDLIEHPLNPMALLKKSSELLDRKGLLLILTPNGDTANYEEFPTLFRVDLEHMQYFTPDTCLFIASELKLRIVHLESYGFPSLIGIDTPISKEQNLKAEIKKKIKSLPGFSFFDSFRMKLLTKKKDDERTGAYHLFCLMQKPA
jgi:2-polyprenyl-3-methyl-5-hydroxy-6-metoxy-1,4-benzoquinol methylase